MPNLRRHGAITVLIWLIAHGTRGLGIHRRVSVQIHDAIAATIRGRHIQQIGVATAIGQQVGSGRTGRRGAQCWTLLVQFEFRYERGV
jgi:hypothetical protein